MAKAVGDDRLGAIEAAAEALARRIGLERRARDLAPLASLTRLVEVSLFTSKEVADLGPPADLQRLRYVDLRGCDAVTDLAPLRGVIQRGGEVEVGGDLREELARLRAQEEGAGAPEKP